MSNNTLIALMTKIQLLFGGTRDTILVLVSGLPWSSKDLSFSLPNSESNLTPQEATKAAADFARLVNLIPQYSAIWSSDGRLLWDAYNTVLTQAVVAQQDITEEEQTEYDKARKILDEKRSIYDKYHEAWMLAQLEYNNRKLSAETSNDPIVIQGWQAEEPKLKAKIDAAYADWVSKGYRAEVLEAIADIDRILGSNPQIAWHKWKTDFTALPPKTDPLTNQVFYETYFWPTNFYKPEISWINLTLDAGEIDSLYSRATNLTRTITDYYGSFAKLEIVSLSVELARVDIIRPWFAPQVFRSRFWRWPDQRELLSDGQEPPQGTLPAYATIMVFARNLEIELKPKSEPSREIVRKFQVDKSSHFGPFLLKKIYYSDEITLTIDFLKRQKTVGYDFWEQKEVPCEIGDFYFEVDNGYYFKTDLAGQRGIIDLSNIGSAPLDRIEIPIQGYTRSVTAVEGHTYVSQTQEWQGESYVVFQVLKLWGEEASAAVPVPGGFESRVVVSNFNAQIQYLYLTSKSDNPLKKILHSNRLQLVAKNEPYGLPDGFGGYAGYDFSEQQEVLRDDGDLYFHVGGGGDYYGFDADRPGQRGIVDLGNIGLIPIDQIDIPHIGYLCREVYAILDHTYVALAKEEGYFIFFKVIDIFSYYSDGRMYYGVTIEYSYLTLSTEPEALQQIGFICQKLPKSPNPALTPPSPNFKVVEVILSADPFNYEGPCPVTIRFSGRISVVGNGTVAYKFLRSDGASAPVKSIAFSGSGSQDIEDTWIFGKSCSGWEQIQILDPVEKLSNRAEFTIQCREGGN